MTEDKTVALIEEIQCRVYDTAKARVLTLLEVALGNEKGGLGNTPAGRMLEFLLADVRREITEVANGHGIDWAPEQWERARLSRLCRVEGAHVSVLQAKQHLLEMQLEGVQQELRRRTTDVKRYETVQVINGIPDAALDRVATMVKAKN